MNEKKYLTRAIFLETIAAVPGMVAGMHRHMKALRTLQPDGGWIHHLLEEDPFSKPTQGKPIPGLETTDAGTEGASRTHGATRTITMFFGPCKDRRTTIGQEITTDSVLAIAGTEVTNGVLVIVSRHSSSKYVNNY